MTRGFTLLELLAALVIFSLALAISLPNLKRNYDKLQADSVLLGLERDIRNAQYHSVMEGRRFELRIDRPDNTYRIYREENRGREGDWVPVPGAWGRLRKLPSGIRLDLLGRDKVLFLPDGSVSAQRIQLRAQGRTVAVLKLGESLRGAEIEKGGLAGAA
ncbi:MAG: prepilin-type N-terminal cleavage/methylation domain-containing protein [Candidatus Omnitrophica bacterium]|nr:prepilin-type N-terminal cleavage/methylation domain-containing protein [Candidatus Omnitrophota bacterium]